MYLKDDYLKVRLGRVTMESSMPVKPAFVLDPDAITGWLDGVDVRRDITQRALAWGDFPERGYKSSRMITITGTAVATSPAELHFMRDVLMGLVEHGEFEELEVTNMSGPRYAFVASGNRPNWIQKTDTVAVWKLEFYADDPRIYGRVKTVRLSSSDVIGGLVYPITYPINYSMATVTNFDVVSNLGNTTAYPIAVVSGDFYSGFTLSNGEGQSVIYTGAVTMNSPVTIDMMKRTATQNGFDRSTYLNSRDFFSVEAGKTISPRFTPLAAGSGWCDIIYRDTWI